MIHYAIQILWIKTIKNNSTIIKLNKHMFSLGWTEWMKKKYVHIRDKLYSEIMMGNMLVQSYKTF